MCTVTVKLGPDSQRFEKAIAEAIRSVLGDEETDWGATVLLEAATGNWNIGAQPGDGEPFHGVLIEDHQTAADVEHMMFGFLRQYKDWLRDNED